MTFHLWQLIARESKSLTGSVSERLNIPAGEGSGRPHSHWAVRSVLCLVASRAPRKEASPQRLKDQITPAGPERCNAPEIP
jgi:hypothetical protein